MAGAFKVERQQIERKIQLIAGFKMIQIPINNVPNQSFNVTLETVLCKITLQSKDNPQGYTNDVKALESSLYFSLETNNNEITNATICENLNPLIKQDYLGFSGNFLFVDTQGGSNPFYNGLNTRFLLVYLTDEEYAQLQ
jgi:hypothetical protein